MTRSKNWHGCIHLYSFADHKKNKSNAGKIFILRNGTSKNADLGGIFPAKAKLMPLYYIPAKNLKAENSSLSLQ